MTCWQDHVGNAHGELSRDMPTKVSRSMSLFPPKDVTLESGNSPVACLGSSRDKEKILISELQAIAIRGICELEPTIEVSAHIVDDVPLGFNLFAFSWRFQHDECPAFTFSLKGETGFTRRKAARGSAGLNSSEALTA